jgi:hypothetical protein
MAVKTVEASKIENGREWTMAILDPPFSILDLRMRARR